MFEMEAYEYVIDLLQAQYERLGGDFFPDEAFFLFDAAEAGLSSFIRAIREMFSMHLSTALLHAATSCLEFTEYINPIYDFEDVKGGIALLRELTRACCPEIFDQVQLLTDAAHARAAAFYRRFP
ncbi:MAG: hypothetical protein IJ466_03070 [Clostridia bacterium]|nr:hypothetical protein [Clostridia bacterium]